MNARFVPALIVLAAAFILGAPRMLGPHGMHVLVQVLLFAYLSSCWNILGGYAGQVSFGHALFMAIGAYGSTLLLLGLGLTPWLGMLVGGALAAAVGVFIGYLSFRYRIKGTYFALVTLAFTEIARILALNTPAIGGAMGVYIPVQTTSVVDIKFLDKAGYVYTIAGLLAVVLAVTAWLERSPVGHKLVAIRENEDAAQALGVGLLRLKLSATALSAFLTALGGTFYAHYVTFIDPSTLLNMNMALEITIFAIVGGVGTLFGPLLGALCLVPIAELVRASLGQSYAGVHLVMYGAILVAILLFAPDGLMGFVEVVRARWAGRGGLGRARP